MKIKTITSQSRRDFRAIYECEHCGTTDPGTGYDDAHFHERVIPAMVCGGCNRSADATYRPLATKYAPHEVV